MTDAKIATKMRSEMAPTLQTPNHRLADILLGGDGALEAFVRERRKTNRAWRLIARDLYEVTGQEVDLTHETLRSWFPDEPKKASA